MTVSLLMVEPDKLGKVWRLISHLMHTVYERSNGRIDEPSTCKLLATGEWVMWVILDVGTDQPLGVCAASVEEYASGEKWLSLQFCSGEQSNRWLHLIDEIEDWGRQKGCVKMGGLYRKGWAKKLQDMKWSHVWLEKDL